MSRWTVNTPPNVEDLIEEQVLYIARHSVDNALAWEARLRLAVRSLVDTPMLSIDPDASQRMSRTVRKLTFEKTYLVHYWLDDAASIIRVVGFRHGARLPRPGEP